MLSKREMKGIVLDYYTTCEKTKEGIKKKKKGGTEKNT